jgi:hypothetical protein
MTLGGKPQTAGQQRQVLGSDGQFAGEQALLDRG